MKTYVLLLLAVIASTSVFAYGGSFVVTPPLVGGPAHNTVSQFAIDTTTTNPQTILTNLQFVYKVVIQTNGGQTGPFLITEKPDGSFSFTVPQKINNNLVSAQVYFWGPDVSTLTVSHVHKGVGQNIVAQRVSPQQTNADGNVLWVITTPSFSDFLVGPQAPQGHPAFPWIPAVLIVIASASCIAMFWKNHLPWFG